MTDRRKHDPDEMRLLAVDYLYGELGPGQREEFEALLAQEPELRAEIEQLRAVKQRLDGLPEIEPPAHAVRSVLAAAADACRSRIEPAPSRTVWFQWFLSPQFGLGLAALIVVAVGVYIMQRAEKPALPGSPEKTVEQFQAPAVHKAPASVAGPAGTPAAGAVPAPVVTEAATGESAAFAVPAAPAAPAAEPAAGKTSGTKAEPAADLRAQTESADAPATRAAPVEAVPAEAAPAGAAAAWSVSAPSGPSPDVGKETAAGVLAAGRDDRDTGVVRLLRGADPARDLLTTTTSVTEGDDQSAMRAKEKKRTAGVETAAGSGGAGETGAGDGLFATDMEKQGKLDTTVSAVGGAPSVPARPEQDAQDLVALVKAKKGARERGLEEEAANEDGEDRARKAEEARVVDEDNKPVDGKKVVADGLVVADRTRDVEETAQAEKTREAGYWVPAEEPAASEIDKRPARVAPEKPAVITAETPAVVAPVAQPAPPPTPAQEPGTGPAPVMKPAETRVVTLAARTEEKAEKKKEQDTEGQIQPEAAAPAWAETAPAGPPRVEAGAVEGREDGEESEKDVGGEARDQATAHACDVLWAQILALQSAGKVIEARNLLDAFKTGVCQGRKSAGVISLKEGELQLSLGQKAAAKRALEKAKQEPAVSDEAEILLEEITE